MDRNGLFCSASATQKTEGQIIASVTLPTKIDLTKADYELGLTYLSLVPTWIDVPDLWCLHTDQKEEQDYLKFEGVSHAQKEDALNALSRQLQQKYGSLNMKVAKTKIMKTAQAWAIRLQSNSNLELSSGLAIMLGVSQVLTNETDKVKDFLITFTSPKAFLENSVFYLSCNQCAPNFVNSQGKQSSFLDFIHIPDADRASTIEHVPGKINYVKLDGSLLHNISFTLYNHEALPISPLQTDLFLLFHIRRI